MVGIPITLKTFTALKIYVARAQVETQCTNLKWGKCRILTSNSRFLTQFGVMFMTVNVKLAGCNGSLKDSLLLFLRRSFRF